MIFYWMSSDLVWSTTYCYKWITFISIEHWQQHSRLVEMKAELNEKLLHEPKNNSLEEEESVGKRVWEESKKMWEVAGPAIFTRFSTFGIVVVSQSFIGHIGSNELAAYALVMTVLVRFANGVLVSFSFLFTLWLGSSF